MSCRQGPSKLRLGRNVLDMIAEVVIPCKRSRPLWQGGLIVQSSDLADQAVQADVLRHHVVALERVWSNKMLQKRQGEISVTDVTGMVSSPASQRQRITARLRAEVIKHYDQGMSSRRVAATLGLGRTTVMKILRMAEVEVRPRGRKY